MTMISQLTTSSFLQPQPSKAAALSPLADGNDIIEVTAAEKDATQLRLTVTVSETSTGGCGDDGSIEVEVLCAAHQTKTRRRAAGTKSSLPDSSAVGSPLEGDDAVPHQRTGGANKPGIAQDSFEYSTSTGDIALADQHPDANRDDKEIDPVEVAVDNCNSAQFETESTSNVTTLKEADAVDCQPSDINLCEEANRTEPVETSITLVGKDSRASTSSTSPSKGKGDDATTSMTAHIINAGASHSGLDQILSMPLKMRTRACTEDSSLTNASFTSVEAVDVPEEDDSTESASLTMLDVSSDRLDNTSGGELTNANRSDSGESGCTSTAPMITLSLLDGDLHAERMVAGGSLPIMADDGGTSVNLDNIATESVDENQNNKSVISRESMSPMSDIEKSDVMPSQLGKIMQIRISPKEHEASTSLRASSKSPLPSSPDGCFEVGGRYDKIRLTERLKERLSKRNQTNSSPRIADEEGCAESRPVRDLARDRLLWESRLQAARLKRPCVPRATVSGSNEATDKDNLSIYPETVTFSDSDNDATNTQQIRSNYRKSYSEVGIPSSFFTGRSSRSKASKSHQARAHGIGILQPDGIVFDDALLWRLARNSRYGRLRGEVFTPYDNAGIVAEGGVHRYNHVKIHVYDLMTKDSLVEMPYFSCNFPIGHCFKVVNDGCHMFGTGAYHVGVEVNGIEYAFGANKIIGMCGIFTCAPKESPGYEYRQTIDFGQLHTTKRMWIRFPKKSNSSDQNDSMKDGEKAALDDSAISSADAPLSMKTKNCVYSFCEVESFVNGHAVIQSMAREYMGTDYDLLRKNCCTFALDVCIRLGVEKSDVPNWFYNAAQAGADAEDVISSVEKSVWGMLNCHGGMDPLDVECYNHGFEVIMDEKKASNCDRILTVVESRAMRTPRLRRPLNDFNETASWTY